MSERLGHPKKDGWQRLKAALLAAGWEVDQHGGWRRGPGAPWLDVNTALANHFDSMLENQDRALRTIDSFQHVVRTAREVVGAFVLEPLSPELRKKVDVLRDSVNGYPATPSEGNEP